MSASTPPIVAVAPREPSIASSKGRAQKVGLTTFPLIHEDEPEQGLLPSLLSKVKSTFGSSNPVSIPASVFSVVGLGSNGEGEAQTEAQRIAEAVKSQQKRSGTGHVRRTSGSFGQPLGAAQAGKASALKIDTHVSRASPSIPSTKPSPSSPRKQASTGLKPPSIPQAASTSSGGSQAPSLESRASSSRNLPIQNRLKPRLATATTSVSPVVSVTHSVAHKSSDFQPIPGPSRIPFPAYRGAHTGLQTALHGHKGSHLPLLQHAQNNRVRRSSIATLPDSPSSTALSNLVSGNAELSQNRPYMGGFSLGNDDSKSVRSVAIGKKGNKSVSRIIRRLRGEGLSKHYWMADEHCKECYDCKSVFTAWRRKHHCRICGQIFCGRCAATIIDAKRFGQEGSIRVCNLCLRIMEEHKEEDEDDRRSINSLPSARHPSFSGSLLLDKSLVPDLENHARSPFAASQLFTAQADEPLDSIEEGSVPKRWRGQVYELPDRPETPMTDEEEHVWETRPNTAAPFRRPVDEDGKQDDDSMPTTEDEDEVSQGGASPGAKLASQPTSADQSGEIEYRSPKNRRVGFPRSDTMNSDVTADGRHPLTRVNSNIPLRTRLSSRASQGGLTTLVDSEKPEGLWRTRSHSVAQRPDVLSGASLAHFNRMLRQAIHRAELQRPDEWHAILSKLLLKVSTNVNPNIPAGDSMDVRAFVKVKKVPGGKISDSEYVDGIVITKNVAHKAMSRRLVNPRIMLLTFPLDFQRVENQYISLQPILAQERNYLRMLTQRVIDVRPHIVLVERSASRIALEYLLDAGIAVARSVKLSAIHQVARCTQADVIASMDRLLSEPRLGRCAEFQIKSFEHELIPGRRKTLMRFEGCQKDFGCTLILRGGDTETLRKVKVVADFMALVAYHLKNEVIAYSDEHNLFPPEPAMPTEYKELLDTLTDPPPTTPTSSARTLETPTTPTAATPGRSRATVEDEDERAVQKREAARLTREIALSLEPYLTTALSASAAIRYPPPAPLAKVAELDRRLAHLRQSRDDEEAAQILEEETKLPEAPKVATGPEIEIPSVVVSDASDTTGSSTDLSSSLSSTAPSSIPTSQASSTLLSGTTSGMSMAEATRDPYRVLCKPEDFARESKIAIVEHDHAEQVRTWEWYARRHADPPRPEEYQSVTFLASMGCEGQEKPCVEPKLDTISFYQEGDCTVGQYLENLAVEAVTRCPSKTCERLLLHHFRLFVHGDRRLQLAMDAFPCPSPGHEECIITWSYCRQCGTPSPTTILREETWRMSWGSYLEHCFYPPAGKAGFTCPHDAYRDQIRYFAHRNLAIRIHNESIDIYEPVRPSISLQVKVETKVVLKNREYENALQKNTAFFDSVLFRLRSFDYDIVQPEQVPSLTLSLETLLGKAVADREEMVNLLNRTYKLTPMTDVLALNPVLRSLQDKVVQWDNEFAEVEKLFMPSEKDLKRMTANHLRKLFPNQEIFNSLDRNPAGATISEADEKEVKSGDEIVPTDTEPSTPSTNSFNPTQLDPPPPIDLGDPEDDSATPYAVMNVIRNPFSEPPSPGGESDSTISAVPRASPEKLEPSAEIAPKPNFVSRLPRRSRPAASIADIVKRFQSGDDETVGDSADTPSVTRTYSSRSLHRSHSHRSRVPDASDSDIPQGQTIRPRLRRGKTDQPPTLRARGKTRPELASDAERSYAHNASRLLQPTITRRATALPDRPISRRTNTNPSPTPSGRTSPERGATRSRSPAPPMSRRPTSSSIESVKPRIAGKGKAAAASEGPAGRAAPSLSKATTRRILGTPGTRVTSIARHFDRLQREAERERQKRVSNNRVKRARPVTVTKAKVQVFDNLRDAFKDEFDTDSSSEADDEEDDEMGGYESPGSKPGSKASSPTKSRQVSPKKNNLVLTPKSATAATTDATESESQSGPDNIGISASSSLATVQSSFSDHRSEMSYTDRLQIELPSFETSAPLPSMPVTPQMSNTDTADEGGRHMTSHMSESEMSSGPERSSIIKTLTGLWAFRAGEFTPLEYPLSASEHLFADSKIIIRENEPTSIIAFTLSSKTYRDKMKSFMSRHLNHSGKVEAFMPEDGTSDRASTSWDIVSLDEAVETDDGSRREGGTHLKYDFESGSSTIFCRIFFAEQFAALRLACDCEDSFVESLARCVAFDAAGGKSGSAFLKTKDDRFIAKEISRLEMDALTKFAPAYFDYTRKAFQGHRPSVLAKIYGFFKIGYRNAVTGRSMRMNVLIMENLFYDRRFSKIYDLKGSTRNRLIQPTGKINEVLLDENLMELVYKHPLYLREHSKRILRSALFNDTLFLSNLNVMDYSLVVGVDSEKGELVIGIVDYIRTFTWDKKLESWVKDSAFLGGAGKGEPTIVTPKQYKTRFRTAMERFYFPSVPDRWSKASPDDFPVEDETTATA